MEYRVLGRTGIKVSPLCLGAMNFGGPTPEAQSIEIIHAALDAGINFIDTANVYNGGQSEIAVGKALAGRRDQVILATKANRKVGPEINDEGNSRRHLIKACEDSLRRLNTDYIDLYQMHRPSPKIPIEETLSALTDLVRAGKVRYIGCSTHPAWMVMEALAVSERYGFVRYVSEQPPYNLLDRRIENELVPLALRYNLAIIPWGPLAQGILAGKYTSTDVVPEDSRGARQTGIRINGRLTPRAVDASIRFADIAHQFGKTPTQLAYLWCKDQPGITAPIVGPRTLQHFLDILPVLNAALSEYERKACDEFNPPGGVIADFHNTSGWMKTRID